ncbi:MAG: bifunctional UDP-N-acetylglucosamine diphosphorylase/glucosamine-1-phosphate N-acetyltransferase GlmU [Pseudomonadales bacterium]
MPSPPANQDNFLDRPLEVVVLAAGQGKRMRSALPKVLHPIAGRPMLECVLATVDALSPSRVHVVIGHQGEQVRCAIDDRGRTGLNWVTQAEQHGTAHAVSQALPMVDDAAVVLVTYGDVPLVTAQTLRRCAVEAADGALALVTAEFEDPAQLGRILREPGGAIRAIVEYADASDEERRIREINSGILALDGRLMKALIAGVEPHNAQGEYYLTDLIALAVSRNVPVKGLMAADPVEVSGINDRAQLADAERVWQAREANGLMRAGVSIADPARLDVRGRVSAGEDCFIDINVVLEGDVHLGRNVRIGPGCVIRNSALGDDVVVEPHTLVDGAEVAARCTLGPFARIRPGTVLAEEVRIGNFVETKKARLGRGTKASHLTYLGDATIGEDCNVGAGTVTCNYDGIDKHPTVIGDRVFVGTNSTLVAPIEIGSDAFVAAGSTVTSRVSDKELAVGRGRQRNISGWTRPDRRRRKSESTD